MVKYIVHHGIRIASEFAPETFGRLTTIGPAFLLPRGDKGKHNSYQVCQCSCGDIGVFTTNSLRTAHACSCGCVRKEKLVDRNTKHGHSVRGNRSPEYGIWASMIQRCTNPNSADYFDYGAKGITVAPEWFDFPTFYRDMGPRGNPTLSIHRVLNDKGYCKENCVWATSEVQMNNRSDSHWVTAFGKTQTLSQWSREFGIAPLTIRARIVEYGWEPEKAVSQLPTSKHRDG
jgi:hypothetical protein